MRPEDRKSLNKWKRLTETLKYEEITRTATKKYVYVGVIVNNDILELTISNNPAISTSNSSFYYWSERSLLQNSWLNIYDSKVDILNINIDNDIEINKVICKWVDIVDMLSININIEKDGVIIWEDYFNHSGFNMLERYWNIKNGTVNYSNDYNDTENLLWLSDYWTLNKGTKINYCNFLAQKNVRKNNEFYIYEDSHINYISLGYLNNNYHYDDDIFIEHNGENSTSNINIKGFILEQAKIKNYCSVTIKKYAISSSTKQQIKYWMLSDKGAIIEVSPHLDVFTDEVIEASHGAAIGSIEKDVINHMRMRGLDLSKIFKLLIKGILNDSVSNFYDDKSLINIMNEYHWVENINNKIDKMIVDDKWIDSAMDFWLKQYKEKYDD